MQASLTQSDLVASPPGPLPDRAPTSPSLLDAQAAFDARVATACDRACATIAPSWPLDRSIAVNPHWGRIERPMREVAARMALLAGIRVFPPRGEMLRAWQQGRITAADFDQALRQLPAAQAAALSADRCVEALSVDAFPNRLPLLIDVLDDAPDRHARLPWRQAITQQVSQTCASFFDEHQADWQPLRGGGLYAFWRDTLAHDHGIGILMGLPDLSERLHVLPATAVEAQRLALQRLDLPEDVWPDYLEAVLLTVNGWASWCAYLGWQAQLESRHDPHLRDLLAIRLAWGAIVLESRCDTAARHAFSRLKDEWAGAPQRLAQAAQALLVDEVSQLALEIGYQRQLMRRLAWASPSRSSAAPTEEVAVQAVFCIDVRSEPLRRALEATWPAIQTVGFAGFFGLPLAYTPLGTTARRPQLPGLLAPALEAVDRVGDGALPAGTGETPLQRAAVEARRRRFAWGATWSAASRWPQSAFSFVEAAGVGYLGNLARWLRPAASLRGSADLTGLPARYRRACRPTLQDLELDHRVSLAATILHAMGLDRHQAPLVLLVGHGSTSDNNPYESALDCGACGGNHGIINARVLAQIVNKPAVRERLRAQGIAVADDAWFVPAFHNTTTDELRLHDLDLLPPSHLVYLDRLSNGLQAGSRLTAAERIPTLTPDAPLQQEPARAFRLARRNAYDWSQVRPEWGLSRNAAFIIGRRHLTEQLDLQGRVFLHSYDYRCDRKERLLENILTGPLVVGQWINMEHYFSTVDNQHYGSGSKVYHNVAGHFAVMTGNLSDLRTGLPAQTVLQQGRPYHQPIRLITMIEAPFERAKAAVEGVVQIRKLVKNGWIRMAILDPETGKTHVYENGIWHTRESRALDGCVNAQELMA